MLPIRLGFALVALALASCGSAPGRPQKPAKLGTDAVQRKAPPKADPHVLLGWMCDAVAAGRPGVIPVAIYAGSWLVDDAKAQRLVAGKSARQFSVLAWGGKRAGLFSVAGAAKASGRWLAVGSYAGSAACHDDEGEIIESCTRATAGCAISVAALEPSGGLRARPFEEDPDPHEVRAGAVCMDAKSVVVDIDGDGRAEVFSRGAFVEGGSPPAEIVATASSKRACENKFTATDIRPGVSVVGAADFDDDGRVDLLLLHRRGGQLLLALYSSTQTPLRLERAFEVRLGTD